MRPTALARWRKTGKNQCCQLVPRSPLVLAVAVVAGASTFAADERLRLYGTGVEVFDQTWKPDDVVNVGVGGRALQ
jgi:hypothetical protein